MVQQYKEVTPQALQFLEYAHALTRGDIEPNQAIPSGFEEWQEMAAMFMSAYQRGCALPNGKQAGRDLVRTSIALACKGPGDFGWLWKTVPDPKGAQDEKRVAKIIEEIEGAPALNAQTEISASLRAKMGKVREWLDAYIAWSTYWSPRGHYLFHEAIGVWLLSVVAARRIVIPIDEGMFTPLDIMLVATTGKYAKSTTAKKALALLRELGLRGMVIDQEITPEAYFQKECAKVPENWDEMTDGKQEYFRHDAAWAGKHSMYVDEFGKLLSALTKPNDPYNGWARLFLLLDDCPHELRRDTIARGTEAIKEPYMALLSCLTPDSVVRLPKTINLFLDGSMARKIIIAPPDDDWNLLKSPKHTLEFPDAITGPILALHETLGHPSAPSVEPIMKKNGQETGRYRVVAEEFTSYPQCECEVTLDVEKAFDVYNDDLGRKIHVKDLVHRELHGTYLRFPERALRVAALLAWMDNGGRIEIEHWLVAQEIAERWRGGLHRYHNLISDTGPSEARQVEDKIMKQIIIGEKSGHPCTITQLLQRTGLSSKQVREYLDYMIEIGRIFKYKMPSGNHKTHDVYQTPQVEPPPGCIQPEETKV